MRKATKRLILAACIQLTLTAWPWTAATAAPPGDKSDLIDRYDPGIPRNVSVEWAFPTGFSVGINGGHRFLTGDGETAFGDSVPRMNLFPLSFLMKYSLYHTRHLSQTVGFGVGPYFLHRGQMPLRLSDLDVVCGSTYVTEWITEISQDLFVNLRMRYTQAFQSVMDEAALRDFSTWLGLNLRW